VQLWLQQEGYEPAAGLKPPSAAAAGGASSRPADRFGLGKAGRGAKQQQQQQQVAVLRGMRLLLRGVAVWDLNLPPAPVGCTAGEAVQPVGEAVQLPEGGAVQPEAREGSQGITEAAAAAAAAGGGEYLQQTEQALVLGPKAQPDSSMAVQLSNVLSAVLPVRLAPESTFGAAWQLPASCYSLLQPASAAAAAAAASKGRVPSSSTAAAAAAGGWAQGMWQGGSTPMLSSRTVPQKKRARVLRDGELTLIPYGQSEAELWGRRVHSFLGAVR
jgi:hypothetical protein